MSDAVMDGWWQQNGHLWTRTANGVALLVTGAGAGQWRWEARHGGRLVACGGHVNAVDAAAAALHAAERIAAARS